MNGESDDLKQRHAYESWRGRNTLNENLFIWNFFLSGNEFSGWQAHRIQKTVTKDSAGQQLIRSIWRQKSNKGDEKLLSVDTVECSLRAAAHELLLQMLGDFQGPVVTRADQRTIGDVIFTAPAESMVLFARANLVIMVRNAGRELVPVSDIASQFDAILTSREEASAVVQRIEVNTEGYKVGALIPLGVTPERLQDSPQWYKFFSKPGEVLLEHGNLVYEYSSEGPQEITVLIINPHRAPANPTPLFGGSLPA